MNAKIRKCISFLLIRTINEENYPSLEGAYIEFIEPVPTTYMIDVSWLPAGLYFIVKEINISGTIIFKLLNCSSELHFLLTRRDLNTAWINNNVKLYEDSLDYLRQRKDKLNDKS